MISGYWIYAADTQTAEAPQTPDQRAAEQSAALRTGVVVFHRRDGTQCGKKLIDNTTARLHGDSLGQCSDEPGIQTQSAPPQYHPGKRLDAVRSSFQSRSSADKH